MSSEYFNIRNKFAHGKLSLTEFCEVASRMPFHARVREEQLLAINTEANRRIRELGGEEVKLDEVE